MIDFEKLPSGWFFAADIPFYRWIYRELVPAGGVTAEIGVYRGRSLMSVADIIREKRIRVRAVDLYAPYLYDGATDILDCFIRAIIEAGVSDLIMPVMGDSVVASAAVSSRSLDFVFIDADHSYEAVRADIAAWLPKVKAGAWIGGHDYQEGESGLRRAVDEAFPVIETRPESLIWLARANGN